MTGYLDSDLHSWIMMTTAITTTAGNVKGSHQGGSYEQQPKDHKNQFLFYKEQVVGKQATKEKSTYHNRAAKTSPAMLALQTLHSLCPQLTLLSMAANAMKPANQNIIVTASAKRIPYLWAALGKWVGATMR